MNIEKFVTMRPEDLAKEQYRALIADTTSRLQAVIDLLIKDKFEEIKELTKFSPAGDGMGCDNYYINFACGDILETVGRIKELKKIAG